MKNPKEMTTIELINSLDEIDKEILTLVDRYELNRRELANRFPTVKDSSEFDLTIFRIPEYDVKLYKMGGITNGKKDRH